MEAVANNPSFAKKAGVPQSVGKDFAAADKGVSFKGGPRERPDLQKVNKPKTLQGKTELFKEGGRMATKMNPGFMAMMAKKKAGAKKMATGGMTGMGKVKTAAPSKDGVATKGKTKGTQIVMAGNKGLKSGGMAKKYC
jgi:hypothetical protein